MNWGASLRQFFIDGLIYPPTKTVFFWCSRGKSGVSSMLEVFLATSGESDRRQLYLHVCTYIYIYMYSIQFNSIQFTFAFIHIHIYITFTLEFIALHHIFTIQESSFESLLGWLPWLPWPSSRSSLTGRSNIQNTEAKTRVPSSR